MTVRVKFLLWHAAQALLLAGLAAWTTAVWAGIPPATGRFLVATQVQQGFFAKSVILLIDYGPGGALGIVVNRPTKLPLAQALKNPGVLKGRSDPVYLGGPVSLGSLTVLIRARSRPPDSQAVLTGVYASESLAALRTAVGEKLTDRDFRAYAGYSGWAPGQLDAELEQGVWQVLPAHADDIFTAAPDKLWNKLSGQARVILVRWIPNGGSVRAWRAFQITPESAAQEARPHTRMN